jgi:hypothetical protein
VLLVILGTAHAVIFLWWTMPLYARRAMETRYNNALLVLRNAERQLRAARDAERPARLAVFRVIRDSHWTSKVAKAAFVSFVGFACLCVGIIIGMVLDLIDSRPATPPTPAFYAFFASLLGVELSGLVSIGFSDFATDRARLLVEMDGRGPCPWDD